MRRLKKFFKAIIFTVVMIAVCGVMFARVQAEQDLKLLLKVSDKLRPLCEALEKPGPFDWLAKHEESGQTFKQYVRSRPVRLSEERKIIYVQPIGKFTEKQQEIVDSTSRFLGLFYNCSVVTEKALPESVVPGKARRVHPLWGVKQMLTTYILYDVLKPRLPDDAVACLALTATDLWPGEGWNFVFGQASLRGRIGVWSLARYGDPAEGEEAEKLCLRRTLKLAAHETGHMFSILHCIKYKCGMCGCNHLEEADRRPLAFCAECMVKVCYTTNADPLKRAEALKKFLAEAGLKEDADCYDKVIKNLTK